ENNGSAIVTVDESANTREVLNRVRARIDGISTFPADAENPVVAEMLLEDIVLILSVSGNLPEARLKEWAERVREDLLENEAITVVEIFGARDYELSIEVSEERLRAFDLSLSEVEQVVRARNLNVPGGWLRTDSEVVRLRTLGRKYTGEEISRLPLITRP